MKKHLLFVLTLSLLTFTSFSFGQNCFEVYQQAFKGRGSFPVSDNIYRNVMIAFFDGEDNVYCIRGKVRVERGYITSIFYYYTDGTVELYDKKFTDLGNEPPTVKNGISEMIKNADGQRLRIVFIKQLKPKKKQLQPMVIPDDL